MTELRHLLGLLTPAHAPPEAGGASTSDPLADPGLEPQPGMGHVQALVDRLSAAGLPIELNAGELPPDLPPGLDLAVFRVIQEALTNVIKHAGKPRTSVGLGYRQGGLVIEVADAGRPPSAARRRFPQDPAGDCSACASGWPYTGGAGGRASAGRRVAGAGPYPGGPAARGERPGARSRQPRVPGRTPLSKRRTAARVVIADDQTLVREPVGRQGLEP
jgi:hypothetical protein